jgi:hypothetical protein
MRACIVRFEYILDSKTVQRRYEGYGRAQTRLWLWISFEIQIEMRGGCCKSLPLENVTSSINSPPSQRAFSFPERRNPFSSSPSDPANCASVSRRSQTDGRIAAFSYTSFSALALVNGTSVALRISPPRAGSCTATWYARLALHRWPRPGGTGGRSGDLACQLGS